jgi:hypothetical protein
MQEGSFLKPPWHAYPYPWGSLGWRMGSGESYWQEFSDWFRSLSLEARAAYGANYPEPQDWKYFYEFILLAPDDEQRRMELIELIDASQLEYQKAEYQRGRSAEEVGESSEAMRCYGNVIKHGDFQDAASRYEILWQKRQERVSE